MTFYAYIHCTPSGTPFYVGKGKINRVKRIHRPHNPGHEKITSVYGVSSILVGFFPCSSESIAFDLERGLLKRLRKMGIDVVNLTQGGGGVSGFSMPEAAKVKIGSSLRGRQFSSTHIENLTKSLRGRKLPRISDDHKRRISESNSLLKIGNKNTLGRLWVTNDSENKMIPAASGIPAGWRLGLTRRVGKK